MAFLFTLIVSVSVIIGVSEMRKRAKKAILEGKEEFAGHLNIFLYVIKDAKENGCRPVNYNKHKAFLDAAVYLKEATHNDVFSGASLEKALDEYSKSKKEQEVM